MTRRRRIMLVASIAICLAFATAYAMRATWLPAAGRWLDVGGPPVKADYAFIAAGDTQARPYAAALLYRYGYVREFLLTRPARHAGSALKIKEFDELARENLERAGVPSERIRVVSGDVDSTMDEAEVLAPMIRAEPNAQFIVVTSDYHTRRTRLALEYVVPEAKRRIHLFSSPTEIFDANNWWQTEAGPITYISEYLRLVFYYVRYGAAGYIAAAIVVAYVTGRLTRRYLRRDFFARRGGFGRGRNSSSNAT